MALVPDSAIATIVTDRAPQPVGEPAGNHAADPAGADDRERGQAAGRGGRGPGCGEARGHEERDPGPHRVELPHVAQVPEVGQADRWLAERPPRDVDAEPGSPDVPGSVGRSGEDEQPTEDGQCARAGDRRMPVDPLARAERPEQIRQRGPDGEGADEDADRQPALEAEPACQQLEPDGIDACQGKAGDEPEGHCRGRVAREIREAEVGRGRHGGTRREQDPRRDDVRRGGDCQRERADDEPELDRDRQRREPEPAEVPVGRQQRGDRRRAEPRGHGQQRPGRHDGQRSPAARVLLSRRPGSVHPVALAWVMPSTGMASSAGRWRSSPGFLTRLMRGSVSRPNLRSGSIGRPTRLHRSPVSQTLASKSDDVAPAVPELETIVSLSKRRGFIFPSSEIYGGINAVWDYGPLGVELKNNVKRAWWRAMVQDRDDIVGLDAGILMHPQVWVTSGHVGSFSDPLVECATDHRRFRLDELPGAEDLSATELSDPTIVERLGLRCPVDGGPLSAPRRFNLMFKTFMGPVEDDVGRDLPPTGDRPGLVRQLQERPAVDPQEAAVRDRPDRQVVPQRDQPRQLRLPDARVRADGDAVLRPSARRRPARHSTTGCPGGAPGTSATASRPSACDCASTRPTSWPTTPRRRSTSSTASRSAGGSSRASTTGATSTCRATARHRARSSSTSTRRPTSTSSRGSSRRPPGRTGRPSPS